MTNQKLTLKSKLEKKFKYTFITSWLVHKLHIDLAYFLKGGTFSFIQQIVGVLSGLIVSYLYGHFVSKPVFGEFNLILSVVSLFTFLSFPGIDSGLIRSIGLGFDASFKKAVITKIKKSIWGSLTLCFAAGYYLFQQQSTVAFGLLISAFFFPLLFSFTLFTVYLTARKLFAHLALISAISSLLFLLISAISIAISPTTFGITLGYLLALIIPAIFGYFYTLQFSISKSKPDPNLTSYGIFLTKLSVLPLISGNLGNVILANSLGVETLATYTVANRFLASVQKNVVVFYKPITAKLAQQSNYDHHQTLRIHLIKFIIIGFVLAVGFWFTIPYLIQFFFPLYTDAIKYGRLLSFTLIPLPISWVMHDIAIYQKRKNIQIITNILPQSLKILLYLLLIPAWGILGLIIAVVIDRYLITTLLLIYFFKNKFIKKI